MSQLRGPGCTAGFNSIENPLRKMNELRQLRADIDAVAARGWRDSRCVCPTFEGQQYRSTHPATRATVPDCRRPLYPERLNAVRSLRQRTLSPTASTRPIRCTPWGNDGKPLPVPSSAGSAGNGQRRTATYADAGPGARSSRIRASEDRRWRNRAADASQESQPRTSAAGTGNGSWGATGWPESGW